MVFRVIVGVNVMGTLLVRNTLGVERLRQLPKDAWHHRQSFLTVLVTEEVARSASLPDEESCPSSNQAVGIKTKLLVSPASASQPLGCVGTATFAEDSRFSGSEKVRLDGVAAVFLRHPS
jgi:hypothetical protein